MEPTFFVCYRREDAGYATALTHALGQRHGRDRVFKDITSLPMGHDWHSEVVAAIGRSTHVLALVGRNWMAGVDPHGLRDGRPDPIVFELTEAMRAGRVVVPVLLGGQRMPAADHLPYALHCLPDLNAAHIRTESADTDVTMLVDRLSEPVLQPERPTSPEMRAATRPPQRSGAGRVVGRLVALAVVGVLVLAGVTLSDKLPGLIGSSAGGNEPAPTLAPDQPVATFAPDQPVANRAPADPPVAAKRVLTLSPRSGTMTTRVTATGTGFTPGVQVQLVFAAENIPDDATVADDGSFRASFAVPEFYGDFPNRTYDVKAYERDSAYYATASFTLNA